MPVRWGRSCTSSCGRCNLPGQHAEVLGPPWPKSTTTWRWRSPKGNSQCGERCESSFLLIQCSSSLSSVMGRAQQLAAGGTKSVSDPGFFESGGRSSDSYLAPAKLVDQLSSTRQAHSKRANTSRLETNASTRSRSLRTPFQIRIHLRRSSTRCAMLARRFPYCSRALVEAARPNVAPRWSTAVDCRAFSLSTSRGDVVSKSSISGLPTSGKAASVAPVPTELLTVIEETIKVRTATALPRFRVDVPS